MRMFFIQKKLFIIRVFMGIEIILITYILANWWLVTTHHLSLFSLNEVGRTFGTVAAIMLAVTLTPGIIGRFRIFPNLRVVMMLFRRHFGILTYLCIVAHSVFLYWMPSFLRGFRSLQLFQAMGITALVLATPLFLTSNDVSVRLLKQWWNRIHKLVYIVLFFAALHTFLVDSKMGFVLIGIVVLEVVSYLVQYLYGHNSSR